MYACIYRLVSCITEDGHMLESNLEKKFKKVVEKELNALVWKFVSPGVAGAPDRIIAIPNFGCVFVELKRPGGKLRPLQQLRKQQLESVGCFVWVIDSVEKIQEFINAYKIRTTRVSKIRKK